MAKTSKKTKKSTKTPKRSTKTTSKNASAGGMDLSELSAERLAREMQKRARQLQRKRDRLQSQLEDVERQIAELQGNEPSGPPQRGRRPRNQQPLPEAMANVMHKKTPMSVADIAEAVQKAGYRTTASNFRVIVNNTLLKDNRFKKAERGKYVLA